MLEQWPRCPAAALCEEIGGVVLPASYMGCVAPHLKFCFVFQKITRPVHSDFHPWQNGRKSVLPRRFS